MRGLNDFTFSRQESFGTAPPPLRCRRRNARPSATPNSQFSSAASRLMKSRSDSMLCCRNGCTVVVESIVPACSPASLTTLPTTSESVMSWNVALRRLRCRRCDLSYARTQIIAEALVNSGSNVTTSPVKTGFVLEAAMSPSPISISSPMKNGGSAMWRPSGSAIRIVAMSGSPTKLRTSIFSTWSMSAGSSRWPLTLIEADATCSLAGISPAAGG